MKGSHALFLLSLLLPASPGCLDGEDNDAPQEIAASSPLSWGGNTCWRTGWDDYWIDPSNPASGDHVVVWFRCADNFALNYWTVTTDIPWSGYVRNWMVWPIGGRDYQVFVDGNYYWPMVGWLGYQPWEVLNNVKLY
jgi:hypothetical protein